MKKMKRYNPNTFNAMHAAVAFLLFLAMMEGVSHAFTRLFEAVYRSGRTVTDIVPYMCLQSVVIALGLAAITIVMCLIARSNVLSGGGFLLRKGHGVEMLIAAVGTVGMATLFSPLADSFSTSFEQLQRGLGLSSSSLDPELIGSSGWLILYAFLLSTVLPAIFEELLFRGVILRGFLQFGKAAAVILSAVLFALAHGNVDQLIYQFLLGAAMGYLYLETRNLAVCCVVHFTNNFFVTASSLIYSGAAERAGNTAVYLSITEIMFVLIGAVCLISALIYFIKHAARSLKKPEQSHAEVCAMFVVPDPVFGPRTEETPWFSTGRLATTDGEEKRFSLGGANSQRLNRGAKFLPVAIAFGVGLVWSIVGILLVFLGI
ncbi:MAG: CPBP family intramembrane metalloprotease [Clostridia bacterium]|nr:CPBP family intramembrane metalloprotease [Clostridia bacterium]